jgi:hypothetical protein
MYSGEETASFNASYTLQDVDNEDKFENSNFKNIISTVIQNKTLNKLYMIYSIKFKMRKSHLRNSATPQPQQIKVLMKTLR